MTMAAAATSSCHHVAMLPPPGFLGHLIPFIELSKALVSHHNCTITIIIPHDGTTMKPQTALLQGLPSAISHIFLPPVPTHDLPKDLNPEILLPLRIIRSLPALRVALASLTTRASALVMDLFAPFAIDVARELGIPAYVFYVVAATELSVSLNLPKLDESCGKCEFRDLPEPLMLPGDIPLPPEDLPDSMQERNSEAYKWYLEMSHKYQLADGIIVNSFLDLEEDAFKVMRRRSRQDNAPPVYPVGPLIRRETKIEQDQGSECLRWLDDQPHRSVLYVSFGSGGTLSREQFLELAMGLEISECRFLWVVRSPQENAAVAYVNKEEKNDPLEFLPPGYLERTKGRGMVVPLWAPQIQVLSHKSTAGFMTHSGWNSVLEGVVFGVPLILRPLCFEQKMNAVVLTDGLKAAIRLKEDKNGIVQRRHIAERVKELIIGGEEGKQIRNRMMELKSAAAVVLSPAGSSTKALAQVVQNWTTI